MTSLFDDKYFQYCVGYFLQLWEREPWRRASAVRHLSNNRMGNAIHVADRLLAYAVGQPGTTMDRASMELFLRSAGATRRIASELLTQDVQSRLLSEISAPAAIAGGSLRSSIYRPLRSKRLRLYQEGSSKSQ